MMISPARTPIALALTLAVALASGSASASDLLPGKPVAANAKAKAQKPGTAAPAVAKFTVDNLPDVLRGAQASNNLKVIKEFTAVSGLQGWVIKDGREGKDVVIYTTEDGKVLVAGMLLDAKGENLTSKFSEMHVPKPDYTPAFNAFQKEAATVLVGDPKASAEVTVLLDVNCGFCKIFHRLVSPAIAAGELRVRYVPVGILGPTSVDKAAALLHSKDPFAFLSAAATTGAPESSGTPELVAKVKSNTEMMKRYGFNGTPAVFYKAKGDTLTVATGLPPMLSMFGQLGISGQVEKIKLQQDLIPYLR